MTPKIKTGGGFLQQGAVPAPISAKATSVAALCLTLMQPLHSSDSPSPPDRQCPTIVPV